MLKIKVTVYKDSTSEAYKFQAYRDDKHVFGAHAEVSRYISFMENKWNDWNLSMPSWNDPVSDWKDSGMFEVMHQAMELAKLIADGKSEGNGFTIRDGQLWIG